MIAFVLKNILICQVLILVFISQHGPEAMMAIAFTSRPSVRPSPSLSASTIVEIFETIIATGLKSYEHV